MVKRNFKFALSLFLVVIMTLSTGLLNCTHVYAAELNKTNLKTAIQKAQSTIDATMPGTLGGQYPQSAYDTLKLYISNAQKVLDDNNASQDVVDKTTTSLNTAVDDYGKQRIAAPWDKYNVPDTMPVKKREVRAAWLSTVVNIDWPSTASWKITDKAQRIETQKKDLITELDNLKAEGVNTVFFQVRPTSDAFYKSKLSPWSYWLTGKYDEDPGFDPLQFAIDESHKRCMELHAWCNPYRVSMPPSLYKDEAGNKLTSLDQVKDMLLKDNNNIYAKHPEWIKVATNRFVLDPGIPEAQKYVEDSIMEIVNNYDVDGIHFDDYFYVGSNDGFDKGYSDVDTYNTYADKAAFPDIKDWRRNNTYTLIKKLHDDINKSKPWVKFGISPAGVWRNKSDDPTGSDTRAGIPNYDSAYADTKKWVLEGIIDYICPQVYWSFANKYAPYGIVSSWWSDLLKNNPSVKTQLYIGMGLYWLNPDDETTTDPYWNTLGVGDQEIARQLKFNAANPDIDGSALFTYNSFLANYPNAKSAASMIKNNLWASKALVTSMPWKNVQKSVAPKIDSAKYDKNGVALNWTCNDANTRYFAVYRFDANEDVNINNPLKLIDKIYKSVDGAQNYTDPNGKEDSKYVITALNRISDESDASNVISAKVNNGGNTTPSNGGSTTPSNGNNTTPSNGGNTTPSNGGNTNPNGGTTANNTAVQTTSSTEPNKAKNLPKTGSFADFYGMLTLGCALLFTGVLLVNKKNKVLK